MSHQPVYHPEGVFGNLPTSVQKGVRVSRLGGNYELSKQDISPTTSRSTLRYPGIEVISQSYDKTIFRGKIKPNFTRTLWSYKNIQLCVFIVDACFTADPFTTYPHLSSFSSHLEMTVKPVLLLPYFSNYMYQITLLFPETLRLTGTACICTP